MQHQDFTVTKKNASGTLEPVSGATITFYTDAARTVIATAHLYSDDGSTLNNTGIITCDANGLAETWALDGEYWTTAKEGVATVSNFGPVQFLDIHDTTPAAALTSRLTKLIVAAVGASGMDSLGDGDAWIHDLLQARSLKASVAPWRDVTHKDYGAVGDDTADDTQAIQDAIDDAAVSGSNVVYIPTGDYKISRIEIKDGVVLRGDGPGRTNLNTTQLLGADHFQTTAVTCNTIGTSFSYNMGIEGIRFDRHSSVSSASIVGLLNMSSWGRSWVKQCEFNAAGYSGVTYCVKVGNQNPAAGGWRGNIIEQCYFIGNSATGTYAFLNSSNITEDSWANQIRNCWSKDFDTAVWITGTSLAGLITCSIFDTYKKGVRESGGAGTTVFSNFFINGSGSSGDGGIVGSSATDCARAIANWYEGIGETYWFASRTLGYANNAFADGGSQNAGVNETPISAVSRLHFAGADYGIIGSSLYLRGAPTHAIFFGGPTDPCLVFGSADPSAGAGVSAYIGSVYMRTGALTDDTPRMWIKYGSGNTDWREGVNSYLQGTGAPGTTPIYIGQLYFDDTAAAEGWYKAVDTVAAADWLKLTP